MSSESTKNWGAPVIVGLVCIAAAVWFSRAPTTCNVGSNLRDDASQAAGGDDATMEPVANDGRVHHANEANFERFVLKSDVPVLVDFYAEWCGPCQRLAPILEELARETPDARIVKVDVDRSPRLAAKYGIGPIPSLKLFRQGVVAAQMEGLAGKDELKQFLRR